MKNPKNLIIERILDSPFLLHEKYYDDFFATFECLENDVLNLSTNPEYSKYKILKSMTEFAQLYEQFRPVRITKNDPYFGTVKKMQTIYFYLLKYIDAELLFVFSKSINDLYTEYEQFPKTSHEKINWKLLIDDIASIANEISLKAEQEAVKLFLDWQDDLPYYLYKLVKKYIMRYRKGINEDDIKISNNNEISINGVKIEAESLYEFENIIFGT